MKNTTRKQKQSNTRKANRAGEEINIALQHVLNEFNIVINNNVKNETDLGIVTKTIEYHEQKLIHNKKWRRFCIRYNKTMKAINADVTANLDAFNEHVNEYIIKRESDIKNKWLEDIKHTISLNTAEDIEFNYEDYLGQTVNSASIDILNKKYFSVFNYNELLWIKNFFRRLFGYSPDYPAIKVI